MVSLHLTTVSKNNSSNKRRRIDSTTHSVIRIPVIHKSVIVYWFSIYKDVVFVLQRNQSKLPFRFRSINVTNSVWKQRDLFGFGSESKTKLVHLTNIETHNESRWKVELAQASLTSSASGSAGHLLNIFQPFYPAHGFSTVISRRSSRWRSRSRCGWIE